MEEKRDRQSSERTMGVEGLMGKDKERLENESIGVAYCRGAADWEAYFLTLSGVCFDIHVAAY